MDDALPASYGQEQLWFIDRFHDGLPAHNVPYLIRLRGPLDVPALGRALSRLSARHEVLRTRLVPDDGRPVRVVGPPAPPLLPVTPVGSEAALRVLVAAEAARPFSIADEAPLRAVLARPADGHALLLVAHRTALDDASFPVLLADLAALYGAETGTGAGPPAPPSGFAGHVRRERESLAGDRLAALSAYWRGALAGFETVPLPTDRPRPPLASHDGATELLRTDPAPWRAVEAPPPVVLLAATYALLYRYTGQDDLVVGTAGPGRPDGAGLVGPFENPLPVRVDLSGDPPFADLVRRTRTALDAARAHRDLPFARLVEIVPVHRDVGRAPVFQVAVEYREPVDDAEAGGVLFHPEHVAPPGARYDLGLTAGTGPDGGWLELCYPPALFDAGTARRMLGHLVTLLRGAAADPSAPLSALPLLTPEERHRELVEWNNTATPLPVTCVHEAFEEQAARTPDAVAVESGAERVRYADLNRWANRIARRLRDLGVGPERLVGVAMDTGPRRIAALLAVWKAGGGYVPLDASQPADRLSFLIGDTGMAVLLADRTTAPRLPAVAGVTVLSLDDEWPGHAERDDANPSGVDVRPSHVAYVIYTSGSTGRPKGVVVEHRQAVNFLRGMVLRWRIGRSDAVLQFAAVTFDVSVMDMFLPLIAGGRVVLADDATLHSPHRLAALIRDRRVTFACLPPAVLTLLVGEDFPDLRILLSAGEELSAGLLAHWLRPGLRVYNGYGPTEACIGATFMRLTADTPLPPPIGRPKPNYRAYVLDGHLNPVPVGVPGELHIGGAGVARGYLNRPRLTAERFITDPFVPGGRLYKTGDLARRRPDGTLVFAGRIDDQVKIRGLRIELGEIEAALAAHPTVAQAVAAVVTDPAGERQLAGYVRPADGRRPDVADLRAHLARVLPGPLVPSSVTVLDRFPLTPHGKIDKAALPAPGSVRTSAPRVPPGTLIEAVLIDMYAGLLGTGRIGATDGFFDAGGNSLQAMQLVARLRGALAVDVDVTAVFLAPTPRQLAAVLRDRHGLPDDDLDADGVAGLERRIDQEPGGAPVVG